MTIETSLSQSERDFLLELYQQTNGDESRQVNSTAIGDVMGIDKPSARKLSEGLIGYGFVVVKTLSGGIGITADGMAAAQRLGASGQSAQPILGKGPVIDKNESPAVESALEELKKLISQTKLAYDAMAQLVMDIKTIEVQLLSPKPKTSIVKECLIDIQKVLKHAGANKGAQFIAEVMGTSV